MGRKGMECAIAVPETLPFGDKILSPLQQPTTSSGRPTLTKQASQRTMNCLCSPTTHVGSFRCRHHRSTSHLRSAASVGSGLSAYGGEEGGSGGGAAFSPKLADLGDKVVSGSAAVRVE